VKILIGGKGFENFDIEKSTEYHPKIPLSANMVFLDGIWDFSVTW